MSFWWNENRSPKNLGLLNTDTIPPAPKFSLGIADMIPHAIAVFLAEHIAAKSDIQLKTDFLS